MSGTGKGFSPTGNEESRRDSGNRSLRSRGRVYQLKPEHFALIAELDRLFPARAPVVKLDRIVPGAESVETVALQLFEALLAGLEQPMFVCFCHVNAERLLDAIDEILDRGAYPLGRDEVLADLYARMYEDLRDRSQGTASSALKCFRGNKPGRHRSIFALLTASAADLVRQRVALLAACDLPLPGLDVPEVDPGELMLKEAHSLLQARGVHIPDKIVRHWVAHAMLQMSEEERRPLFLRDRRGLSIAAIGQVLGLTAFDAGVRLRQARLNLKERIVRTVLAFRAGIEHHPEALHQESGERDSIRPGNLIRFPDRRGSRSHSTLAETVVDDSFKDGSFGSSFSNTAPAKKESLRVVPNQTRDDALNVHGGTRETARERSDSSDTHERGAAAASLGLASRIERLITQVDATSIAKVCWRAARAILAIDSRYRLRIQIDTPGLAEPKWVDASRELEALCLMRMRGNTGSNPASWTDARGAIKRIDKLRDGDQDTAHGAPLEERISAASRILLLGNEYSRGNASDIHVVLSTLDWMYGDSSRVPDHLDRALVSARSDWGRAEVIGNLAVWEMDQGHVGEALRLNGVAMSLEPTKPNLLRNELIWRTLLGQRVMIARVVRYLASANLGQSFWSSKPGNTRRIVRAVAGRLGLSIPIAERRARESIPCWR